MELTDFTWNDIVEWEKKQIAEQKQRSRARPVRSLNPDLHRMSLQVKEVLPHVPLNSIYNDLCKLSILEYLIFSKQMKLVLLCRIYKLYTVQLLG